MKRMKLFCVLLAMAMLLSCLAGCGECNHQWLPADCRTPRTCNLCGETDGEPNDKHIWEEATTDRPRTCSVCYLTDGDKIEVDERFITSACKDLFGTWVARYEMDGSSVSMPDMTIAMKMTLRFTNEGELIVSAVPQNASTFKKEYAQRMAQKMYEYYEQLGMNQTQADADCLERYGMTVPEFCEYRTPQITMSLDSTTEKVYYVEDGLLYIGEDWGDDMSGQALEILEEGTFKLEDNELGQILEFRKTAG